MSVSALTVVLVCSTMPPGVEDEALSSLMVESNAAVACTKKFIKTWVKGEIILPNVEEVKTQLVQEVDPEPEDEVRKNKASLGKSSSDFKEAREREH